MNSTNQSLADEVKKLQLELQQKLREEAELRNLVIEREAIVLSIVLQLRNIKNKMKKTFKKKAEISANFNSLLEMHQTLKKAENDVNQKIDIIQQIINLRKENVDTSELDLDLSSLPSEEELQQKLYEHSEKEKELKNIEIEVEELTEFLAENDLEKLQSDIAEKQQLITELQNKLNAQSEEKATRRRKSTKESVISYLTRLRSNVASNEADSTNLGGPLNDSSDSSD